MKRFWNCPWKQVNYPPSLLALFYWQRKRRYHIPYGKKEIVLS